jgi:hypothetical protein
VLLVTGDRFRYLNAALEHDEEGGGVALAHYPVAGMQVQIGGPSGQTAQHVLIQTSK